MAQDGVVVETDLFEHRAVGAHFINPCCFGEDLAQWLKARLDAERGLGLELSEPIQEDYGWGLRVHHGQDRYWIAVSFMGEGPQEEPAQFMVSTDWSANPLKKLFAKPVALAPLRAAVRQALAAEPAITILD